MSDESARETRLVVEVTTKFWVHAIMYRGRVPALVIDYGGYQLVLTAHRMTAYHAKEFALILASAALGFAGLCNRLLLEDESGDPLRARPNDDDAARHVEEFNGGDGINYVRPIRIATNRGSIDMTTADVALRDPRTCVSEQVWERAVRLIMRDHAMDRDVWWCFRVLASARHRPEHQRRSGDQEMGVPR